MFKDKISIWKAMPRNNEEELTAADTYFDETLMPLSRDKFVADTRNMVNKTYYGVILTLGTSWQPLALSISALKPQRILVLGTEAVRDQMVKLVDFLHLQPTSYEYQLVDRGEPIEIYKYVKTYYDHWHECGNVAVDITGGTKAMASSAAMIAAELNLDVFYVESKYLPLYRRPEPGSEHLQKLMIPKEFFNKMK